MYCIMFIPPHHNYDIMAFRDLFGSFGQLLDSLVGSGSKGARPAKSWALLGPCVLAPFGEGHGASGFYTPGLHVWDPPPPVVMVQVMV